MRRKTNDDVDADLRTIAFSLLLFVIIAVSLIPAILFPSNTLVTAMLPCPYCHTEFNYVGERVLEGSSRGETYVCPKCANDVFVIVYYDGEVVIEKK